MALVVLVVLVGLAAVVGTWYLTYRARQKRMAGLFEHAGTERDERLDVRRDRAPSREITAGQSQVCPPEPRQEGAEQQHRAAQPTDQRCVGLVRCQRRRTDA